MPMTSFDQLPDTARLWVFAADRPLSEAERRQLAESVETGLAAWAAHGSPVTWGHTLVHEQFLMVGVDESQTALTGCSIDSAVSRIRELERRLEVSFLDNSRVFYRDGAAVRVVNRLEFRELAKAGTVTGDTVVFNNVLETVRDVRAGNWEVPAVRSWHGDAFPLQTS